MPKNFSCVAIVAAVASVAFLIAAPANADVVPLLFSGPAQTFNGSLGASGNLGIGGTALFLTIPTQTIPVSLKGTPSVTSHPISNNPPDTGTLVAPGTTNLVDINSLDLDILNGQTSNFAINTLNINAIPFPITLDVSGTLTGMTFSQTAASVLTTLTSSATHSTGTFSVPGTLGASLGNLAAILGAFGSPLYTLTLGPQTLNTPLALTGTWDVAALGLGQRKVQLDGSVNLGVPLSLVTSLVSTVSTINLGVDLNASITVAVGFHLETITVPEPASIALLGVGLIALVPVVRRWRRK